jgi:phosphoserine phosphatase RsbU/P
MGTPLVRMPGPHERLRDIQHLTDAALSHLDAADFLPELLDRAKVILQADTAAALLLDRGSGDLVAAAASGLDEEVRQGVRIPIGQGFAGRIAAERRPVIIEHVDHGTVLNPILLAKGVKSLLGVPLMASGSVVGVLHVGSLTHREFTDADVEVLQLAAERAAAAVQSQMTHTERSAASVLQRSLLPAALPAVPGLEMAARFVPGNGKIGGDWYDVFTLPSGETCAVIGDVAGSGLQAAVVMGRIRAAVRSYALVTRDPAGVLTMLDEHVQHFEPGVIATVLYAVFQPGLDKVEISSAGHFAPIAATPGFPAAPAPIATDVLIGAAPVSRRATTIPVPVGTTLCLYTDGLVERRGSDIDDWIELMRHTLAAAPPASNCAAVMQALVGRDEIPDDVALLMVRRTCTAAAGTLASVPAAAVSAAVRAQADEDLALGGQVEVAVVEPG